MGVSEEGVGKCVGVWGRVEKSGGDAEKCRVPTHSSTPPPHFFTSSPTVPHNPYIPPTLPHIPPYLLYHLLHAKISRFSHLLPN